MVLAKVVRIFWAPLSQERKSGGQADRDAVMTNQLVAMTLGGQGTFKLTEQAIFAFL